MSKKKLAKAKCSKIEIEQLIKRNINVWRKRQKKNHWLCQGSNGKP